MSFIVIIVTKYMKVFEIHFNSLSFEGYGGNFKYKLLQHILMKDILNISKSPLSITGLH